MTTTQANPNLVAFLSLIAWSEGTSTHPLTRNHGYDVIVTGSTRLGSVGLEVFTSYFNHPFAAGRPAKLVAPGLYSTASGRYQVNLPTWGTYQRHLNLPDFGTASQDRVALAIIQGHGALSDVWAGRVETAIVALGKTWASFAGSPDGQPTHRLEEMRDKYASFLNNPT